MSVRLPRFMRRSQPIPRDAGPRWHRALMVLALAGLAAGQSVALFGASEKLSGNVPVFADIDFNTTLPQISPDGQYAVYGHDAVVDGAFELWSVRMDGVGNPERLSEVLSAGQRTTFGISPDSSKVVYMSDQQTTGRVELFSVDIDGGVSTKLNSTIGSGRNVLSFRISPQSDLVFYVMDKNADNYYQLFVVPMEGGTTTQLSPNSLTTAWDIDVYEATPDGSTVVFHAISTAFGDGEVWSVPALGPTDEAERLNPTLVSGGAVTTFLVSPNGSRVVYRADASVDERFELYSVPTGGGSATKLNGTLASNGSVDSVFQISADGTRVVYRADQSADEVFQLYSVPIAGGTAIRLNETLATNEDVALGFQISPDSDRVAYRSDENETDVDELYSVAIGGGTPLRINGTLASGGDVLDLAISPDGSRVVYTADQTTDGTTEIYSVPIGGGTAVKLNRTLGSGGNVQNFRIAPNGTWVIYGADQDLDGSDELLAAPLASGSVLDVSGPLVSGGDVVLKFLGTTAWQVSSNGYQVLYAADQNTDDQIELYAGNLPAGAPGPPRNATATAGNTQATVTFLAPISNGGSAITGYTVTSSPAGGVDSDGGETGLSHVVTGLTNGVAYTFTVVATNIVGPGPASSPSNSVTPGTPPGAPTAVTATAGNAQATVTFVAPTNTGGLPITGYTVTSSPAGGVDSQAGTTSLSHIVTGLTNGTVYTFTVKASNAMGLGTASAASNAVTPATVPGAPTAVVAVPGNTQASVSFTPPASNGGLAITGYTVTSNPAGGVDSHAGTTLLTHLMTGLTNGTAYTFTVRATNPIGQGAASAPSTSVTPATVPGAPTAVLATPWHRSATVAFTAPASNGGSAITGYTVISDPAGGTDTNAGSTGLSHHVGGLTNGVEYTFTVQATNVVGPSAASTPSAPVTPACGVFCDDFSTNDFSNWSFFTQAPGPPVSVVAVGGNGQATVTFAAPLDNGGSPITGYAVTSDPAGGTDTNAGTTGLSHVVTGLANGTAYTFTVTATNALGTGTASAPSNSVTPATVPDAPTGAIAVGGNTEATVTFVAPVSDGGSAIIGYTVISDPAGGTDSDAGETGLSHGVTGLTNGTSYTFTVTATNAAGTGPASAPSNSVTPATVPGAPTAAVAVGGNAEATVTFVAPVSDGGSAIIGYTVISDPAGGTDSDAGETGLSHVVTGLTNGTEYTFTVTATNSVGTGAPSSPSNPVTPSPF